jgi:predicted MPP superfamily phosphohydrolase
MRSTASIEPLVISCPSLPADFENIRILHISDLHLTRWTRRAADLATKLKGIKPDLLAVTGDLGHRSWRWKTSLPSIERLLQPVTAPLGRYFILGNHDASEMIAALEQRGFTPLMNRSHWLRRGRSRLALVGLAQHKRIDTDIPAALTNVPPDAFKLMLMHYPDFIHAAAAAGVNICLAGHTHGGQICYPDGKPIIRHDVLPNYMCTGVHRVGETWLVVNRGVGKAGLRVRMFCPPHVIVLRLQRGVENVQPDILSNRVSHFPATTHMGKGATIEITVGR